MNRDDVGLLTPADVEAIVSALEKRIEERFYSNLGKGLWALFWKAIIGLLLVIAAYGIGTSQAGDAVHNGVGQ